MASVNRDKHPDFATFELDADEAIDIRKTALMAAAMVYQGQSECRTDEYISLAKSFEEHLLRGVPKSG